MKKILFVANIPEHLFGFHYPYMKWFKEIGWKVHTASSKGMRLDYCDNQIDISVERTPFHFSNIKAYFQLKRIIESGKYDLIHCNTAVPSILTILAARKSRKIYGTKVINTIHGFWFYKGASIKNWLFYPITKFCARYTDCLITINKEDYVFAQKKMNAKKIYNVSGVGFKDKFLNESTNPDFDKEIYRKKYGIVDNNTLMILSVGEINKNKNHRLVIEALSKLTDQKYVYFIAGEGASREELEKLTKEKNIDNKVIFLGFRDDVYELMHAADIFVFPSRREGLPVSLMEAMASSLPCIASNIRGNNDLIDESGGILFENNNLEELITAFEELINDKKKRKQMGEYNREKSKKFSLEAVLPAMKNIYQTIID